MNNKTAMQEFSEWLKAYEYELPLELQIKAKECLAVERQQIDKAYFAGLIDGMNKEHRCYYFEIYIVNSNVIRLVCDCEPHTFYEWEKMADKCSKCNKPIYEQ